VLLLGPSGSGKSTLLAALAGLLEAGESEGELLVDGADPRTTHERVGIVFQDPETQIVMGRAGDEVAFGLENRCVSPDEIWSRVDEALEAVGFAYGRDRPTDALSGGEQQRLALAGVLALQPGLLLLDEPTANLDPDGSALVRTAVRRATRSGEKTLLLVEHRVADALELVERAVVLEAGAGVVADGTPAEVFASHGPALAAAGVWVPDHPLPVPPLRPRGPIEVLLAAERVTYRYPGGSELALPPTDAAARSSEALAVVGPNGSGKSTLAMLLGGLVRPTSGVVTTSDRLRQVDANEPWRWPAAALARRIGSVFQDPEHQFLTGRVIEELMVGPRIAGADLAQAKRRADALLERLHLATLADANPFTLSGGEKRRLSVATALADGPSVLILDEPTFGQDRRTAVELLDLLAAARDDGAAVCIVTHDAEFAAALADRTLRLPASEVAA